MFLNYLFHYLSNPNNIYSLDSQFGHNSFKTNLRKLYCIKFSGNIDGKVGAIGFIPQCLPKSLVPVAIIRVDEATHQPVRDSQGLCIRCEQGI